MTEVQQGPTPRVRFREVSALMRCPLRMYSSPESQGSICTDLTAQTTTYTIEISNVPVLGLVSNIRQLPRQTIQLENVLENDD